MGSAKGRIMRCGGTRFFQTRKAAAVVEFAVVLPLLLIIFVAAVDFARVFYNAQVLTDCARTAALFAANPDLAHRTSYESVVDLARTCVADLNPQPTFSFTNGTDTQSRAYVEATVSQSFTLICPFVFQSKYQISRTARAHLYPAAIGNSDE